MRLAWFAISAAWRHSRGFNRHAWIRFSGWLIVFSALAFGLIAMRYLLHVHSHELYARIYLLCAYLSHFGFLAALLSLPLMVSALLLPARVVLLPASALLLLASLVLLALDTIVYDQYRFHLNGFVWDLVTGPGASEIFHFSRLSLLVLLSVALAMLIGVLIVVNSAVMLARKRRAGGLGKWLFIGWLGTFLVSQSMHIWYEARYDASIAGISRHLPVYFPMTAKRAQVRLGWLDPSTVRDRELMRLGTRSNDLRYPVTPLVCRVPTLPKNVLVVVIDSMRADAFTEGVMPRLYGLTARNDALLFTDHFSGGNATKGGIFSLFYGVSALYWDAFAAAGVGAEWIRQHQFAGYRIGVFSSTTLQSPAFDRTVFASVPTLRLSSDGKSPSSRDKLSIADFERFVSEGDSASPWFGFLFLDSAHSYEVPQGYETFQPQWARVDHVLLNEKFDPSPYINRYRNALGFIDDIVGQLIERLGERGALDNTVVILTSDHGEEFNDLGKNYWGHGSNFFEFQIKVPLLVLWPGKHRHSFHHRTSHFDIAPTIMSDILGCLNPVTDYSIGKNLFDTQDERDWLIIHSYFNFGVVTKDPGHHNVSGGWLQHLRSFRAPHRGRSARAKDPSRHPARSNTLLSLTGQVMGVAQVGIVNQLILRMVLAVLALLMILFGIAALIGGGFTEKPTNLSSVAAHQRAFNHGSSRRTASSSRKLKSCHARCARAWLHSCGDRC